MTPIKMNQADPPKKNLLTQLVDFLLTAFLLTKLVLTGNIGNQTYPDKQDL